tara:strand:+ start:10808 stop:11839 length:1032 start_codon:yes stop_codon:yes gene_type:complete
MTENTYYKPRLVIGDKEITSGMEGTIKFSGNSQANTCTCKITDPELQNYKLNNKELKVYLNYGADDGVPIFRGFIKEVKPNDTETNIIAVDPRMLMTGRNSRMIELTDDNNYDGYSLAGFLYAVIDEKINTDNILIGLDTLRDTNPIVSMKGERTSEPTSIYDLVKKKLKEAVDDDDIEKPLTYFIDMIDDGKKNNITFIKEKQISETPSLYLSEIDGIIKYRYNRRTPPTYAVGGGTTFQYTNEPRGSIGISITTKDFKDKKTARMEAIKEILMENRGLDEITITASKGHYSNIGSIVRVKINDSDISGNHRLTSKSIKFSAGGIDLSLSLDKKPLELVGLI